MFHHSTLYHHRVCLVGIILFLGFLSSETTEAKTVYRSKNSSFKVKLLTGCLTKPFHI